MRLKKVIIAVITVMLIIGIAGAMFSNSHELYSYKNETDPWKFCNKCHPASVTNVSAGVHSDVNCLCHGYNPNTTPQVNMVHNLTKKIYCTNCHSKYNETTGDITLYTGISGLNQSAHYIISKSDSQLYNNSMGFFNET